MSSANSLLFRATFRWLSIFTEAYWAIVIIVFNISRLDILSSFPLLYRLSEIWAATVLKSVELCRIVGYLARGLFEFLESLSWGYSLPLFTIAFLLLKLGFKRTNSPWSLITGIWRLLSRVSTSLCTSKELLNIFK